MAAAEAAKTVPGTCTSLDAVLCRFNNDDSCGDWVLGYGLASQLQLCNVLSAICFAAAGLQICRKTWAAGAQHYGVMLCLISLGSASFHATSGNTGFILDIAPMAASGGMLLHAALRVLQLHAGRRGRQAELRCFAASAGAAAFAVWVPWALIEAGVAAEVTWAVWAVLFGSFGAIFGVVSLLIFREYKDNSGSVYRDVAQAVAFILPGLLCTTHSFVPGLCSGVLARFPFHALWHASSAVSAFKSGCVLDAVLTLTAAMEQGVAEKRPKRRDRSLCPLLLRMVRDAMPSQFSM